MTSTHCRGSRAPPSADCVGARNDAAELHLAFGADLDDPLDRRSRCRHASARAKGLLTGSIAPPAGDSVVPALVRCCPPAAPDRAVARSPPTSRTTRCSTTSCHGRSPPLPSARRTPVIRGPQSRVATSRLRRGMQGKGSLLDSLDHLPQLAQPARLGVFVFILFVREARQKVRPRSSQRDLLGATAPAAAPIRLPAVDVVEPITCRSADCRPA